MALFNKCST